MKKLTRKNLDELAKVMPVINESFQMSYIGGGNGTKNDPYTVAEYDQMSDEGTWNGGYVKGWGYTSAEVTVTGGSNKSHKDDTKRYNGGTFSDWFPFGGSAGFQGGSYSGGTVPQYENWFQGGTNSGSTEGESQGGTQINDWTNFGFGVAGDFGDAAKGILDDRGKYMPDGKIYTLKTPVTVRLPIGGLETNAKVLNAVRVGGKWMGIIGAAMTVGDVINEGVNGNASVAATKATVALAQAGCMFIPGVGWAISISIGVADLIWGEELYESLK